MARRTPAPPPPRGAAHRVGRPRRTTRISVNRGSSIGSPLRVSKHVIKNIGKMRYYILYTSCSVYNSKKTSRAKLYVGIWMKLARKLLWVIPLRLYRVRKNSGEPFSKKKKFKKIFLKILFSKVFNFLHFFQRHLVRGAPRSPPACVLRVWASSLGISRL